MGRARKPIDQQKGNLTQEQQNNIIEAGKMIIVGNEQLDKPPAWLVDSVAKKEWKRIVKEFQKIKIIGNLDVNNLAVYCNAYSENRRLTKELGEIEPLVDLPDDYGNITRVFNPEYKEIASQQRYFVEIMRKYAGTIGLTIDSRLKVGTIAVRASDDEIGDKFGDI